MIRTTFAFALGLGLMLTASAHAQTGHIEVRKGRLDLSQPAGAHALLARLERASMEVCGSSPRSAKAVQAEVKASDCYADALGKAVADFKAPSLNVAFAAAYPVQSTARMASVGR